MSESPNQQNVIGQRLFRQSLIIALIMTGVLTFLQIWLNFRDLQNSVTNTFEEIKQVQLGGISTALWNYSMPELKTLTAGIVDFPFVTYAEVSDTNKVLASSGVRIEKNFREESIPIYYLSNGKSNLVGYLHIQANNTEIYATLIKDVIQIFFFSAINVIILTFIFLLLIDRQVTRHLHTASEYFKNYDFNSRNNSLKLNKTDSNDELDSLVTAINQMQTNLSMSYAQQTETERKHATLLSNLPGMAYRCKNDRDWTMEVVSAGCQELTGFPPESIIDNRQQSYNSLILPEDREIVWNSIQEQLDIEQSFELTYRIQSKKGEIKWVWERGMGIYSSAHELIAIEGFITDVTERKQQERELEAIASVSIALRSVETRDEIIQVVLEKTTSLLSANGGLIELIDPANGDAVVEIASGSYHKLLGARFGVHEGLNSYIRETGKPYINNDAFNDPRNISKDIDRDFRAACGVPMIAHGQLVGFLWIARNGDISEKAVNTLASIADIAANTIYRVRLLQQKEQQVNQLTGLRKIDTAINSNIELPYTLQTLLDQTIDLLHVKAACIASFEKKSQMVNHIVGAGFNRHYFETNQMIDQTSITGKTILGRKMICINNLDNELLSIQLVEQFIAEGFSACFSAPLIAKEEVIGVLQVFLPDAFYPDSDWIQFLETLAGQAAIAISDSNMVRNLKQSNLELEMAYDATLEG